MGLARAWLRLHCGRTKATSLLQLDWQAKQEARAAHAPIVGLPPNPPLSRAVEINLARFRAALGAIITEKE